MSGTNVGDSIAVNGVCLTVTKIYDNSYETDVMPETMKRSSLNVIKKGNYVNLERALTLSSRLGGHIVSGHIDGIGKIEDIKKDENAIWYTIKADRKLTNYIVEKGSVALDGISLTVAGVSKDSFDVSIIPHTQEQTNLKYKAKGDTINIECDIIGKYVEKMLNRDKGITKEFLSENGFL